MILLICVDDNNGVMFNSRRQGQDRILRKRINELTAGKKLWMSSYSAKQFESEMAGNITVSDSFLFEATQGDYCFVEDADPATEMAKVEKIVLFKWNRKYPFDRSFEVNSGEWKMTHSTDFIGNSHEKITEEVYERV